MLRYLIGFLFLICYASALPMVALKFVDPSTSAFIERNKPNKNIRQNWIAIDDVSLYFSNAVIAAEDQQFVNHFGFDLKQIYLVVSDASPGLARGASTISQQTVKNMFLWPKKSLFRKAVEAWLTLWMELILPKQRILELYINFAQFGKTVFGIGAAAPHYYGVNASQLTARQAALIAASLPTPSRSNPARPSSYLNQRADYILDQMPRVGGRRLIRELLGQAQASKR